jgi:hypothetical protein
MGAEQQLSANSSSLGFKISLAREPLDTRLPNKRPLKWSKQMVKKLELCLSKGFWRLGRPRQCETTVFGLALLVVDNYFQENVVHVYLCTTSECALKPENSLSSYQRSGPYFMRSRSEASC